MRTQFLVAISLVLVAATACPSNGGSFTGTPAAPAQGTANARTIGANDAAAPNSLTSGSVNWSEFGFIPSGGRFNPDEQTLSPRNVRQLRKLWSTSIGCNGSICGGSSAAVANGVVYVGSYDGNVYAFGL
jgi:outer membrane protein assembly factor BamB